MAQLPVEIDFSKEAIESAVLSRTLQEWYVKFPGCLGVVGGAAGFAFHTPELLAAGFLAVVAGVAAGIVRYFFCFDAQVADYLREYNDSAHERAEALADYLQQEFGELEYEHGVRLVVDLRRYLVTIREVLARRFEPKSASYQQFLGPAEVLFDKTLGVLKDAAIQLRANQVYDSSHPRQALPGQKLGNANRQRQLFDEGTKRFGVLVASVDQSITGLAELTQDVARITSATKGSHDDYIQRVREIASRAKLYVDERSI